MLCSVRLMIAILGFFGFMCMNAQRTAIGVAIVCMVNHTALENDLSSLHSLNSMVNGTEFKNVSDSVNIVEQIDEDCPAEKLGNNTNKETEVC